MKEQLQDKLVEIITQIQSAVVKASDFAMDQIPDIAVQYVVYGRALNTISALACIVLFTSIMYFGLSNYRRMGKENEEWRQGNPKPDKWGSTFPPHDGSDRIGLLVLTIGASAFPFFIAFEYIQRSLLVWIAPKVWLIQEIGKLVK